MAKRTIKSILDRSASGAIPPESRGQLTLASPDPLAHPRIKASFPGAESDRQPLITGVRISRDILGQSCPLPAVPN